MNKRLLRLIAALTVATWALLPVLGMSSDSRAQGKDNSGLQRAIEVQEKHTGRLMARRGVMGTAVGLNKKAVHVVKIYVEKPQDRAGLPRKLDGVPVVAAVSGKFRARGDTTSRYRPAPIGVSTGHPNVTAGTIGARVVDGQGTVYALSNNHVYADENRADIGDEVLQPGAYDGGEAPDDVLGTLSDFEALKFDGSDNDIDAAIAESTVQALDNSTLPDGYGVPSPSTVGAELKMKVRKYGRTTGMTKGFIDGVNATVDVGYDSGVARFVGQIVIKPGNFSAGGDSGSLIVTQDGNHPVGLLFAGSRFHTIANPIGPVLERFEVTIDSADVNDAPVAEDDAATTGKDTPVTIDVLANDTDADGDSLTVTQLTRPSHGEATVNDDQTVTYAPDSGFTGEDSFTYKANDGTVDSNEATVTVTVTEQAAGVTVDAVDPAKLQAGATADVTISGTGFVEGADVTFENGAGPAPEATSVVVVDANTITAEVVSKSGGPPRNRVWDVRVTNPDGSSGVLIDGFTLIP